MSYSFHRGALSLDLVGTVGARGSPAPEERMATPADLGRWLEEAGLLAGAAPGPAELAHARALREAIWQAGCDVLEGKPLHRPARAAINDAAQGLRLGAPRLTAARAVEWETASPVSLALARVAADAIEILAHHADRLTRCALEGCGALLLSRSRSEARRWCSMETCGNRAKVAAFRHRQRRVGPRG